SAVAAPRDPLIRGDRVRARLAARLLFRDSAVDSAHRGDRHEVPARQGVRDAPQRTQLAAVRKDGVAMTTMKNAEPWWVPVGGLILLAWIPVAIFLVIELNGTGFDHLCHRLAGGVS